jgi:hypothetical protein
MQQQQHQNVYSLITQNKTYQTKQKAKTKTYNEIKDGSITTCLFTVFFLWS